MNKQKLMDLKIVVMAVIRSIEKQPGPSYSDLCDHYYRVATAYQQFMALSEHRHTSVTMIEWPANLPHYMHSLKHVNNGLQLMQENMKGSAAGMLTMIEFFEEAGEDFDFDTVFTEWLSKKYLLVFKHLATMRKEAKKATLNNQE